MHEIEGDLSRKEKRYLDIAANLAMSSNVIRYKHGAVIVKGGRILSTGINKFKNDPKVFNEDIKKIKDSSHVHAEVDAIRKVSDVRGAKIYIARVNKNGGRGLSRPCDSCYNEIINAGITKIVYTN